jgi:hypothetical protein
MQLMKSVNMIIGSDLHFTSPSQYAKKFTIVKGYNTIWKQQELLITTQVPNLHNCLSSNMQHLGTQIRKFNEIKNA